MFFGGLLRKKSLEEIFNENGLWPEIIIFNENLD